ncbi:MAG: polymer-forming cytoskeletal protein [Candidatus Omnitrophota bacterium]
MSIIKRNRKDEHAEKILDVDANMQGTMVFKDPVNLRINGNFEGKLDTKGTLTIGESAEVEADISGEDITVAGKVNGNIVATARLSIISPGIVTGDIKTPILNVTDGAVLNGRCQMSATSEWASLSGKSKVMELDEVARYLEVENSLLEEWAAQKKIPAIRTDNSWRFYKEDIDTWVSKEKISR